MNFKKNLFVLTIMAALCAPTFANHTVEAKKEPAKTVTKEIKSMIEDLKLDLANLKDETIHLKFMVNEKGEIIVISTNESKLDKTLKAALNYQKIESKELTPYNLYIVPIKFDLS